MNYVEFLRDMASRALRLSRNTLDLQTSRELRIMGEELKAKSLESEEAPQNNTRDRSS